MNEPSPPGILLWTAPPPARAAVYEQASVRWLEFGHGTVQTRIDIDEPHALALPYTQALAMALLLAPEPHSVLLLGLGGGALAHYLLHHIERVTVDAVESSAAILGAARDLFALPRTERLRTECADARTVAARTGAPYDLVILDVFDESGLPPWVCEPPVYEALHRRLEPGGMLAANLWVESAEQFLSVISVIRAAFDGRVLILPVPGYRNLAVFAMRGGPDRIELAGLRERARAWLHRTGIDFPAQVDELVSANPCAEGRLVL